MYGVVTLYFPHLEGPFNTHPSHHVTVPFFINGRSHHPRNPDSPVPYSCKLASSTVIVFNRIYITPSFHISFFRISIFFSTLQMLVLDRTTSILVDCSSWCVQCMTLIIYSCIVSRLGLTARHHASFLNAFIYGVTSFSPLNRRFPYDVYMYQRHSLSSRIPVQVVPIQCVIQYCDQRFASYICRNAWRRES